MKTIFIKLTLLASLFIAFTGCNDDDEVRDTRVTAVKQLYEPTDGKTVVLQSSTSASLYFEWEPCRAEDSGMVLYEVAFDKVDGNFSSPVYITASDNNGGYNHATISHKQMNKIAAMMGLGASETGTFKWTIFSSKGINAVKAEKEYTITVTRLAGFADIPIDVYVTGEGSEGGTDLSKAVKMKAIAGGEFEVYTQLTADKSYYFTDALSGTQRKFYTEGGLVKEDGTSTIATSGVYRITLDFNTGACTYTEVTSMGFYFSPEGKILFNLDYAGYGEWKASGKPIIFQQESWGRDQRYKFRMFLKEDDTNVEYEWGTLNGTDSPPTSTSPESYYYLKLLSGGSVTQWDNKWKLMSEMDGALVDISVYLQADIPYTHSVTKVGVQ